METEIVKSILNDIERVKKQKSVENERGLVNQSIADAITF